MTKDEALDIVVVEDDARLRSVLSEVLRELGHTVRAASDGFEALAVLKNEAPDVLISDLFMPGMSGLELLSVVRRRFPSISVIAMSGAYSGGAVPPGVAADAFYAKGKSSILQLIQMVSMISRDEAHPSRSSAPIWISDVSVDSAGSSVLFVSCPECLRPSFHSMEDLQHSRADRRCPHCSISVELGLVRQVRLTDETPISTSPAEMQVGQSTMTFKPSGGTPTGRMHQG